MLCNVSVMNKCYNYTTALDATTPAQRIIVFAISFIYMAQILLLSMSLGGPYLDYSVKAWRSQFGVTTS